MTYILYSATYGATRPLLCARDHVQPPPTFKLHTNAAYSGNGLISWLAVKVTYSFLLVCVLF